MKQKVYVTVFSADKCFGCIDWPPEDPVGFMAWFEAKFSEIPRECLSSAQVSIASATSYESDYPTLEITYTRLETDEEEAAREAKELREKQRRERTTTEQEKATLRALLRKYGPQ